MNKLLTDIFKLSAAERIQLAEDLWDSIAADSAEWPELSDTERSEIEQRLSEHEGDPSTAVQWRDVRARLWSRLG